MKPNRFNVFLIATALGTMFEVAAAADSSCEPGFNCLERASLYVSTHITHRWQIEAGLEPYDPFYYDSDADSTLELVTPYYSIQPNGAAPRSDVGNCRLVIAGEKYPARGGNNRKVYYYDNSSELLTQDPAYDLRFLIGAEQMTLIKDLRQEGALQQTAIYLECAPMNGFSEHEKFYVDLLGDYTPPSDQPDSLHPDWWP